MRLPSQAKLRGMQQTSTAFSRFPCKAGAENKKVKEDSPTQPLFKKQANENGN